MIIGRTRKGDDFSGKSSSTLSKEKYYYISHLSRECLIRCGITRLPVSLSDVVKKLNIRTIKYSKLKKLKIKQYVEIVDTEQGFSEKTGEGKYYIFYDDSVMIERQRFTIAHEIGHILLEHFEKDILEREKEANMFAARLLMPMVVLKECDVSNIEELRTLCFVSNQAATYRFKRLQLVGERNKFYTDRNERKLQRKFKRFKKEYLRQKGIVE